MAIWTCTKLLKSSKVLWSRLSENFFSFSAPTMMIQISGKSAYFGSKQLVFQKPTDQSTWKFLKPNFSQIKYTKYCLHRTTKFGTLTQLTCFIFLLLFEKWFKVTENAQNYKFEKKWGKVGLKICLLTQFRTKYLA